MKKFHAKRLLKLANYLCKLPKNHVDNQKKVPTKFDMCVYSGRCGTTACAMGHACFIESFNKAGLTMCEDGYPVITCPNEAPHAGRAAEMVFFGLNYYEAQELFGGEHTRTAKRAARVIRDFVHNTYPDLVEA